MRLIRQGSFYNKNGVKHAVKIYDRDLPEPGPVTPALIIESPGYELTYNSGITDVVIGGIIESECSIFVRNRNNLLDDFLLLLKASDDRFLLEILRAEQKGEEPEIYWSGVLLNDFNSIDDAPEGTIQLTALDGIGMLMDEEVDEEFPIEYGDIGFMGFILDGLNIIPSSELWDYHEEQKFLYCRTDWFHQGMAESFDEALVYSGIQPSLYGAWIQAERTTSYSGADVIRKRKMNYREVINHILVRFNAVLLMVDGAWHILQREMAAGEGAIEFQVFKKQYGAGSWRPAGIFSISKTANIPIHNAEKRFRGGGKFDHLPGLKKVKTIYDGGDLSVNSSSLLPNDYQPAVIYETFILQAGEGNKLHIGIGFKEWFLYFTGLPQVETQDENYVWWGEMEYRLAITLEVEGGNDWELRKISPNLPELKWYELDPIPDGGSVIAIKSLPFGRYWDEDIEGLSQIELEILESLNISKMGEMQELELYAKVFYQAFTPDLPANGKIKFQLIRDGYAEIQPTRTWEEVEIPGAPPSHTYVQFEETGEIPDVATSQTAIPFANAHFLLNIVGDVSPILWAEFNAENETERFSLTYELERGIFGSMSGAVNPGQLIGFGGTGQVWRKGFGSVTNDYFNQLLVNEIMSQQSKMLLVFSGIIYDNNPSIKWHPFQAIYFSVKGITYYLCMSRTVYNAQTDSWKGDWVEISRIIENLKPLPPVVTEAESSISKEVPQTKFPLKKPFVRIPYGTMTPSGLDRSAPFPLHNSLAIYADENGELRVLFADGKDLAMGDLQPRTEIITTAVLYNFPAVSIDEEGFEISSSEDWDLPTDDEFKGLEMALGMSEAQADATGARGTDEGAKLAGLADFWDDGDLKDSAVFGSSGFNAIGSGRRAENGDFAVVERNGYFWTKTKVGDEVWARDIGFDATTINRGLAPSGFGYSARLTRAATPTEIAELSNGDIIKNGYIGNDGKSYDCIYYAEMVWMAENLAETRFRNGALIPIVEDDENWEDAAEDEIAAICYYDNDISLSKIVLEGRKYFNELLEARTIPEALDELSIGGLRVFIEKGKVLKIGEHYEYGIDCVFTVDGKVDCEGILRIR